MPFGERIKSLREAAGLKQSDVANAVGVSSQAVSKWETNKSEPDREAIRILCKLFDISADRLLNTEGSDRIPDDDIKFAVFGDPNVTDAQYDEIKQFAKWIRERDKK